MGRTFAPTTACTVTDPQIESLFLREQDEGDLVMAAVCMRALDTLSAASSTRDVPRSLRINDASVVGPVMLMTVEEARAACARVIAETESNG
jgi:hypothetical protein